MTGSLELSIPTGYPGQDWMPAITQLFGTFQLAHACAMDTSGHHCDPPSWIREVTHPNTDLPLWVKVRERRRHGFSLKHQLYYSIYDVQWQKKMKLLYFISRECKLSAFSTWTTSHLLVFSECTAKQRSHISENKLSSTPAIKLGINIGIFG